MAALTVVALSLSIGQWQRPIPGMLVDPFGIVDNFGWPSWDGYHQGLAYPDRVVGGEDRMLVGRPGVALEELVANAARTGSPQTAPSMRLLLQQGAEVHLFRVRIERLGLGAWMVLCGGYLVVAWVWLCVAGLLYTVRPQSRAVGAFVRSVLISATLLITLFDFHTTRKLVPITLIAFACMPAALIEFGMCFPERLPGLQARPRLLMLLRLLDVLLITLIVGGYFRGYNLRIVSDLVNAAALVTLTVTLSLRCATAHGRRRVQILVALMLLLPIYGLFGCLLILSPERAVPYLYVGIIPMSVVGACGLGYTLLRYDLIDSRTLLRRFGFRQLFATAMSFVVGLLCAIGYIVIRRGTNALPVAYVLVAVTVAGPLVRRVAEWVDNKLFPTEVHYRDTVEQLSLRFTDLHSQAAVIEAVEQTVRQVVDCARVRLLPMQGPLFSPGTDSAGLGKFLPKVAQVMAAAIANEKSSGELPPPVPPNRRDAPSSPGAESAILPAVTPTPEGRNLRALRRIVKAASLFVLSPEQESALALGELVYLTPKTISTSSMPPLWSWLLISVRFRDRIVGILAVAPKSVAQIFTPTSESLLRTIANQAALALYCASVSEQFDTLRHVQENQAREQFEAGLAALADELSASLKSGQSDSSEESRAELSQALKTLAVPRALDCRPQMLRPLIDQARQLLRDRLASRLLEVDVPPQLEIDCDGPALTQILGDLLENALDVCPSPGRVGLSVSIEGDQRLRVSIWDSGPGPLLTGERLLPLVLQPDKRASAFRHVIAWRLGQAHGWELSALRRGERNSTDLVIPATAWRRRRPEGAEEEDEASGI